MTNASTANSTETKVDFYVLDKDSQSERFKFVCRFVDKLQKIQKTAHIVVEDSLSAQALDELLWQFPGESFLPHTLHSSDQVPDQGPDQSSDQKTEQQDTDDSPILIQSMGVLAGEEQKEDNKYDVLINLSSGSASTHIQYSRIVEVVIQAAEVLTSTRARYKFYREQGYPLQSHPIQIR